MIRAAAVTTLVGLLLLGGVPALAADAPSRCAECHFANFFDVPAPEHLGEWQGSVHARAGVGCERCHGGDATTFEPIAAHTGILGSRNPASGVNRRHLPQTCGTCHPGPSAAFAKSRHDALLREGEMRAPSCSTCHGAMTARRPALAAFEAQCARCHETRSATADYPTIATARLEQVGYFRARLNHAQMLVSRIEDADRRQRLTAASGLAVAALKAAIESMHSFEFQPMKEQLDAVRVRIDEFTAEVGTGGSR